MKKLNNFIKSRAFIITLSLTFIALIIVGVTYAWFTWTSTDNTNITMQIGEYTTVTYTGGNAINITDLAPVYNYTDGESTTFTLTNNNTDVTKEFKYSVYLDITSISNELKTTQFKYVLLDGSSNIIDQGNFSAASNGSTLTITENKSLPNGNSSYTFLLYIDGNEQNNNNMMNKSLTGSLRVVVNRGNSGILPPNPLSDYSYILGSDQTEITEVGAYYDMSDTCETVIGTATIDDNAISIEDDEILLVRYIGDSSIVTVPDTFEVDGNIYNTVLLAYASVNDWESRTGTFAFNEDIEEVYLSNNIQIIGVVVDNEFARGSALQLFYDCVSLTTVPTIPNSVTNLREAFRDCDSLVNAPIIPSSVTNMISTFDGCSSLVNAPEIPESVTNMFGTFYGCSNLTGTVRINSSNVSIANGISTNPFKSTSKPITVEVPAGSTTYTNINTNLPANVTLTTFTP